MKGVLSFLDSSNDSGEEKLYKQAFLAFYRYFLRKDYSLHVLINDKIGTIDGVDRKLGYFDYKNKQIYLPRLREKREPQIAEEMIQEESINSSISDFNPNKRRGRKKGKKIEKKEPRKL